MSNAQLDGQKVIELQKIKKEMKVLATREKELKGEIYEQMVSLKARKVESSHGTVSISSRKRYFYTDEVEALEEELKVEKKKEESIAMSREGWEALGRPAQTPVYDETESLRVAEPRKKKEK